MWKNTDAHRCSVQKQQDSNSILANLMRGGNGNNKVVKPVRGAGGFATQRAMGFARDAGSKDASDTDESKREQQKEPARAGIFSILNKD